MDRFIQIVALCIIYFIRHAFIFLINYKQFRYLSKRYSEYQNWLESGNPDFLDSKNAIKRHFRRANILDETVGNNISAYANFPSTDERLIPAHEDMFFKGMRVYREKYSVRVRPMIYSIICLGITYLIYLCTLL